MSEYTANWFVVPTHIMNLPGLTLAYLRVYETIFQFWNHRKACFLSNPMIMERTGIDSDSTIREAFRFFEKCGELIRRKVGGRRYLVQPESMIEIESEPDEPVDKPDEGGAIPPGDRRYIAGVTGAIPPHNNKKLNNKNINKSSLCEKAKNQKHDFAHSMDAMALEKRHIEQHEKHKSAGMSQECRRQFHDLTQKLKFGMTGW